MTFISEFKGLWSAALKFKNATWIINSITNRKTNTEKEKRLLLLNPALKKFQIRAEGHLTPACSRKTSGSTAKSNNCNKS